MTREIIMQKAISTYGYELQMIVAMEECAELQQALAKFIRLDLEDKRGPCSKAVKEHIREEIADVQIMIDQMRLIFGNTKDVEDQKIRRLEERVRGAL